MATRRVPLGLMLGVGALVAVFGGAGVALAADHAVAISGFSYSPGSVTVAVGDTVTWTNSDAQAHTATADDGSWNAGTLTNGASGTVTFSTAGTFRYVCSIHPEMSGTVTVQAAAGGGDGGAGATTPPTDTEGAASAAAGAPTGGGPTSLAAGLLLAGAWVLGLAIARGRFVPAR